jgi:hypothetical protein
MQLCAFSWWTELQGEGVFNLGCFENEKVYIIFKTAIDLEQGLA